jgi:hypothetical protein
MTLTKNNTLIFFFDDTTPTKNKQKKKNKQEKKTRVSSSYIKKKVTMKTQLQQALKDAIDNLSVLATEADEKGNQQLKLRGIVNEYYELLDPEPEALRDCMTGYKCLQRLIDASELEVKLLYKANKTKFAEVFMKTIAEPLRVVVKTIAGNTLPQRLSEVKRLLVGPTTVEGFKHDLLRLVPESKDTDDLRIRVGELFKQSKAELSTVIKANAERQDRRQGNQATIDLPSLSKRYAGFKNELLQSLFNWLVSNGHEERLATVLETLPEDSTWRKIKAVARAKSKRGDQSLRRRFVAYFILNSGCRKVETHPVVTKFFTYDEFLEAHDLKELDERTVIGRLSKTGEEEEGDDLADYIDIYKSQKDQIIVQRGVAKKKETQTSFEQRFTVARPLLFDTATEFMAMQSLWLVFLNSEHEKKLWTGKGLDPVGKYLGSGQFHTEIDLLLPELVKKREQTESSYGSHTLRACYSAFIILLLKNHAFYESARSYNDLYLLQKILGHNDRKTTDLYNFINAVNYLPQDGIFDRNLPQEQLTKLQAELEVTKDTIEKKIETQVAAQVKAAIAEAKINRKRNSEELEASVDAPKQKPKQKRKFSEEERTQRLKAAIDILKEKNLAPTQRNVRGVGGLTGSEFKSNYDSGFWNEQFQNGKWVP